MNQVTGITIDSTTGLVSFAKSLSLGDHTFTLKYSGLDNYNDFIQEYTVTVTNNSLAYFIGESKYTISSGIQVVKRLTPSNGFGGT
jgi:hypothetical protein